jgi:hypothetical protein
MIATEIYRLERYKGLTRKKNDEGLWAVAYWGDTIQEIVDQFNKEPYNSKCDLKIIKIISVSELITDY